VPVYRYDAASGRMVCKDTGAPMTDGPAAYVPTPRVIGDIEPYPSPVTGEYISGRAAKRDDLRRHGCIDSAELGPQTRGFRNPGFIRKRGLQHLAAEGVSLDGH